MKKHTFPFLLSILLILAILLSACSLTGSPATPTDTASTAALMATPAKGASATQSPTGIVTASGKLMPSTTGQLSFAQGGVVSEVLVKAGDTVAAGDVIARLEGIKSVQADLAAAQDQYSQTLTSVLAQDKTNRAKNLYKVQTSGFTLPTWYYDQQEQMNAAQNTVKAALTEWEKTRAKLASVMKTTGADFAQAEVNLANAQSDYQVAKNLNDRIKDGKAIEDLTRRQLYLLGRDNYLQSKQVEPKWVTVTKISQDLRDEAKSIFDDADQNLKDMQTAYDDAISTDGAKDVLKARGKASVAQEHYYTALDYVRALQTGTESQTLTTANTAVDKVKAVMDLYELRAPFNGTILSTSLKVGESVLPGAPVAFLADAATWTVETKDLAEIDIARVALGQNVTIKLDALPGEDFAAKVTTIDPVGKEYLGDMTYKVTVTLDKADPRFKWNMTATVNIQAN